MGLLRLSSSRSNSSVLSSFFFRGRTSFVGRRSSECCDLNPSSFACAFCDCFVPSSLRCPFGEGFPFSVSTAGCSWRCTGDHIKWSNLVCQGSSTCMPDDFSTCTHVTSMCVFFFRSTARVEKGSGIFTKVLDSCSKFHLKKILWHARLSLAFSSIFSHSDLFHNGLTGSIPPQMLMLTKLTLLYAPKWNILLSVGHILH